MQKFKDNRDREWSIDVDAAGLKRVQKAGVALFTADGRHDWFQLIAPDDKPLARVIEWEEQNDLKRVVLKSGEPVLVTQYRLEGDPVNDLANAAFIVNTPSSQSTRADEVKIRSAAVTYHVSHCTNLSAALATVLGIRSLQSQELEVQTLQEYHA